MRNIHYYVGARCEDSLDEVISRTVCQPAWRPFDSRTMDFVGRFSRKLLTAPEIRQFPELAALGHWFRPARLLQLANANPTSVPDALIRGRGFVLHLAPSNVDSVFMYSWLIALLSGNCNIVRVSQKLSPQLDFLVRVLQEVLDDERSIEIVPRIILLTYPHDDEITHTLSMHCMVRVVWGGDATVAKIRSIGLRPTATEICFPDRFSAAAINAQSILCATTEELAQLAHKFFNDAFWFAQQACSSPRMVAWIGSAAQCERARQTFWAAIQTEIALNQPENSAAMAGERLNAAFELAAAGIAAPTYPTGSIGYPARLELSGAISHLARTKHCGNGLFLERQFDSLNKLAPELSDKEQTLSVHGFSRLEIEGMAEELPPRALDRVVQIGEALGFAPVWDGIDLFVAFTRKIAVPLQ